MGSLPGGPTEPPQPNNRLHLTRGERGWLVVGVTLYCSPVQVRRGVRPKGIIG